MREKRLFGCGLLVVVFAAAAFFCPTEEEDDVKIAESHCIDGIVVIADDNIIGCVNGTQPAGNTWVPR